MLQHHQPDDLYCVYCHQPASGPCATCQAMICVDCAVVSGGSVKRVAVCTRCDARGAGRIGLGTWGPVLRPVLGVCALLAFVVMLIVVLSR